MNELSKLEKEKILKIIRKKEIRKKDVEEAIKLIKKTNSYQEMCRLAENFVKKTKESLKSLPGNRWNKILENIANFVIQREE